jgi:Amt family ammonium transporter
VDAGDTAWLLAATAQVLLMVPGLPFYGGGLDQVTRQTTAAVAVLAYSFVVTYVIGLAIDRTIGFRVEEEVEVSGIDQAEHLETAYEHGGSTLGA